jgi:hypothetical protein
MKKASSWATRPLLKRGSVSCSCFAALIQPQRGNYHLICGENERTRLNARSWQATSLRRTPPAELGV